MDLGSTQPLNRNEYQEYFVGYKNGWQPYRFHVPIVCKSGSFALLEPPGPDQASARIALQMVMNIRISSGILLPS
jgi:hypothetical protein